MVTIDWNIFNRIKEEFKDSFHEPDNHLWHVPSDYRYIKIYSPIKNANIYYYVDSWCIEFRFDENDIEKYNDLLENLINETQNISDFIWDENFCKFQYAIELISEQQLMERLHFFVGTFNQLIHNFNSNTEYTKHSRIENDDSFIQPKDKVDLHELSLLEVLKLPLKIPLYQRIYCWEEENVKQLLNDLSDFIENNNNQEQKYRLGTIILHHNEGKYDIIDGQQRLVTLAITLYSLGVESSLLKEKFVSSQSLDYLRYNKYIVNTYIKHNVKRSKHIYANYILKQIEFSVLILQNTSLDLAYTFFSTTNSRGVALTDYDLLKAHHLRYIPSSFVLQSERAARVWNKMIEDGRKEKEESGRTDYEEMLDTFLYRLRKWVRKDNGSTFDGDHHIKNEFQAAAIISELPPFGEHFDFYEPIQGGTHFFAFTERYMHSYHQFMATKEVQTLRNYIYGGTGLWYRNVIEALLFGYYLKFGDLCLADALMVIMRIVLQHRYYHGRANEQSILSYVASEEIIMSIQQSTSPTFFLAEEWNLIKEMSFPPLKDMGPTKRNLKISAHNISKELNDRIVVSRLKNINS